MDIENLTIKQVRELQGFFSETNKEKKSLKYPLGSYVIVRSRNEGINSGFLIQADETGCVLERARRIWYHKPKDQKTSWYEGVAQSGLSNDSKISCEVEEKYIIEDYSITICTIEAMKSILKHPSNETN